MRTLAGRIGEMCEALHTRHSVTVAAYAYVPAPFRRHFPDRDSRSVDRQPLIILEQKLTSDTATFLHAATVSVSGGLGCCRQLRGTVRAGSSIKTGTTRNYSITSSARAPWRRPCRLKIEHFVTAITSAEAIVRHSPHHQMALTTACCGKAS
jgi:hypothetical protein